MNLKYRPHKDQNDALKYRIDADKLSICLSLSSLVSVGGVDAQYLSFDAELEEERSSKLLSNALVLTPMNSPRRKPAKENEVDGEANFNQFREINDQKVRVRALISNQYLAFRFMYV